MVKLNKKTKEWITKSKKRWAKTGKWIENNINPDVYTIGGLGDIRLDVDPWNPLGVKNKKRRKR